MSKLLTGSKATLKINGTPIAYATLSPGLSNYAPGNFAAFPKYTLRIGTYFNPRIAALFILLIRLGVIKYYP